jgi:acetyl-CoA carboxylase biotin carboxyl carrier protein
MSRDLTLEVIVEESDTDRGEILLKSPAVGLYGDAPKVGEVLVGGSRAGRLTSLGRTASLLMPPATAGRVAERMLYNRRDPVDYDQVLLRLVPIEAGAADEASRGDARVHETGFPEGAYAVTSPTHGMFYRRTRPDAPFYVEVGNIIEEGTTLGLVEVMKCFSAITYGGESLPHRAKVIEVRAEDSSEVQADQVLFVVEEA